jgi:hypothetical protein
MPKAAILIGINDYTVAPLTGCEADASALAEIISRNADHSANFQTSLLLSSHGPVLKAHVAEAAECIFSIHADAALFYFAGHGAHTGAGGFLVAQDATKYDLGLPMMQIVDAANRSTSSERIIILDCCHAGAVGELFGSLIDMPLKRGVSILAACRKEQSATERNGRGLFTSHICDALSGGAADVRGLVNVPGIYSYVDEVLTLHEPRPLLKANVSELVPIRRAAPAVADEKLRKLTTYFPKMTHQFQLDPSFEPTAQPDHPVNEAIFADLQQYRAARLLTPDGEEHMFYAAMNSKTCSLTPLGQHYWLRVQAGKI